MAAFNFANTKGFKNFMAKLYGWGASVVILGALFKINHWPGATWMLLAGMGTEAIIFFFSAFEKPHVEVDWSAVYPELAPQYGEETTDVKSTRKAVVPQQQQQPFNELNQLFKESGVDTHVIKEFGEGLKRFSANAQQMVDISSVAVANDGFIGNIKKASSNLEALSAAYEKQLKSVSELMPFSNQKIQTAMDELSNKLHVSVENLSGQVKASTDYINNYQKQMQVLTSNITALNSIYGNMLSAMTNIKG